MRSKEYVGVLALITALLLLKIGTVIALYKASPHQIINHAYTHRGALYHQTWMTPSR